MNCCLSICVGKELVAFGAVVKQMLEDVQQRLTFKAQVNMIQYISLQ